MFEDDVRPFTMQELNIAQQSDSDLQAALISDPTKFSVTTYN